MISTNSLVATNGGAMYRVAGILENELILVYQDDPGLLSTIPMSTIVTVINDYPTIIDTTLETSTARTRISLKDRVLITVGRGDHIEVGGMQYVVIGVLKGDSGTIFAVAEGIQSASSENAITEFDVSDIDALFV